MNKERVAQPGTQGHAISISLIAKLPPAPVHVHDGLQVIVTQVGGERGRVVNQVPAFGAKTESKVRVFAIGAQGLGVAASFEHGRFSEDIVAPKEKAEIANVMRSPFLWHACLTPALGESFLDAFDEKSTRPDYIKVSHVRQERCNPPGIRDDVCVHGSDQLVPCCT